MSNKKGLILVLSMFLIMVLIGCAGGNLNSENNNGKQSDLEGEQVTLEFWNAVNPGSQQEKALNEQIEIFEEKNPNIKIDQQVITYDMMYDNLITAISAGNTPDISWGLSEWFGEFNSFDALLDLTEYFEDWEEKDKIYENVIESLSIQDEIKAIPNYLGIRALLYNKEILSEAGYDNPPKTWDELLSMGEDVFDATGKYSFGIAGTGVRSPQELIMYLAQNDVYLAEEQSDGKFKNTWQDDPDKLERATETFDFYNELLERKVISPNGKSWGWQEEDDNFSLGQYGMVVNGTWLKDTIITNDEVDIKEIGVAAPPYNINEATFLEVSPFYIYKNTEHSDEAWEFAKFMLGKEFQEAVNPDNAPRMDLAGQDEFSKAFSDLTSTGITFPQVALGSITNSMIDALGKVLQENEDSKKTAIWLSEQINEALNNNGELSTQ